MAEKLYEVLPGCAYTGKHRVYYGGDQFEEKEIFSSIDVALKGQKVKTKTVKIKDKEGKEVEKEVMTIKGKEPVVEVAKIDKRKVKK